MRVRILLEERLEMLEIKYEILKIKKSMSKNDRDILNIQSEMKNVREKKNLTIKLLKSISWENWIEGKDIRIVG